MVRKVECKKKMKTSQEKEKMTDLEQAKARYMSILNSTERMRNVIQISGNLPDNYRKIFSSLLNSEDDQDHELARERLAGWMTTHDTFYSVYFPR